VPFEDVLLLLGGVPWEVIGFDCGGNLRSASSRLGFIKLVKVHGFSIEVELELVGDLLVNLEGVASSEESSKYEECGSHLFIFNLFLYILFRSGLSIKSWYKFRQLNHRLNFYPTFEHLILSKFYNSLTHCGL